jgi:hypothetical protein
LSLTPHAINGLTYVHLLQGYDAPKPTPRFHWELWEDFCSEEKLVADAAPREHAKSTSVTHAATLASMLMGYSDFCLMVSDTESQACEFLGDIQKEVIENDGLIKEFNIKKVLKATESNLIVLMGDGRRWRIVAKGSEQKVRGLKWRGKRPDLIVGDDLENDEIVMNPERRKKFRDWFFKALVPCGSDTCKIRIVGTILHLDSLLNRLMVNKAWRTRKFSAHKSSTDFSEILWPEKFSEERLRGIQEMFREDGDMAGYSQEYLNNPVDEANLYFRKQDFIAMQPADHESPKTYYAAADFAISERETADYFVIVVAGIDPNGLLHIVDVRRFRGADDTDSRDIIIELLSVQKRYDIEKIVFEKLQIEKTIEPFLRHAMIHGIPDHDNPGKFIWPPGTFINIEKITPSKSKTERGRSMKAKMKAGGVRMDMEADWYPDFEAELQTITTRGPKGKHDDQFDGFSYIGLTIDQFHNPLTHEEAEDEEYWMEVNEHMDDGRCASTGY